MDLTNLKLVIWDLDDSFWDGTLSEGPVRLVEENVRLIKLLAGRGIVSSICSKNDELAVRKVLDDAGISDYFIFPSIDWTPKGQRIVELIRIIGLRPVNCLFIDDNPVNRQEAKYYLPDLNVTGPEVIDSINLAVPSIGKSDPELSRLRQYHILEKKHLAKEAASDNEAFLFDSDTRVEIHKDCIENIDRITELVNRTNQLNFTKVRSTKEELISLCKDPEVDSGYVTVADRYGDYGLVGFFAVRNNHCEHFLFSCRTIGQGVEQYVYSALNYPELDVVGEVVNQVTKGPAPRWINQQASTVAASGQKRKSLGKVIMKGGCDLKIMSQYLSTEDVIEEFTYIGSKRKNNIEHINHSLNYLSFPFMQESERKSFLSDYVFNDEDMFDTAMFRDDVSILFISTMSEPNLGVYRRNSDGFRFAWGEYKFPLTDRDNWEGYVDKSLYTSHNDFDYKWLEWFSDNHTFCGRLSVDEIISNFKKLLSLTSPGMRICFILGSETPYLKNDKPNYEGRHLDYAELNARMRDLARENNRISLIDVNEYIRGQEDFNDNINHFKRRVYYNMASRANELIAELTGSKLHQKSRFYLFYKSLIDEIGFTGFYQTRFWHFIRKPYIFLKNKVLGIILD